MADGQPRENEPFHDERLVPQWIDMHPDQQQLGNEYQVEPDFALPIQNNPQNNAMQVAPLVPVVINQNNNRGRNQERADNLDAYILQEFRPVLEREGEDDEVALERLRQQMRVFEAMEIPRPCLDLDNVSQEPSTRSGNPV